MPSFGERSLNNLETAHVDLQRLFKEVIKHYDCTVICGHRDKKSQDKAVRSGYSKVSFPNSKHNSLPSRAVDVLPYPIDWNDWKRFYFFGGFVKATAAQLDIDIRWGGDWDSDGNLTEEKFIDLPHFELR
jgi:peptidoglycan LD-endopeptidase CwlK